MCSARDKFLGEEERKSKRKIVPQKLVYISFFLSYFYWFIYHFTTIIVLTKIVIIKRNIIVLFVYIIKNQLSRQN